MPPSSRWCVCPARAFAIRQERTAHAPSKTRNDPFELAGAVVYDVVTCSDNKGKSTLYRDYPDRPSVLPEMGARIAIRRYAANAGRPLQRISDDLPLTYVGGSIATCRRVDGAWRHERDKSHSTYQSSLLLLRQMPAPGRKPTLASR